MQTASEQANHLAAQGLKKLLPVNVDRKIGIAIVPEEGTDLRLDNILVNTGVQSELPVVGKYTQLSFSFCKQLNGLTGTSGVIYLTYKQIPLTVMWSVPFEYTLYSNWYDVVIGHRSFDSVYNEKPTNGGESLVKVLDKVQVRGRMGNGGETTLALALGHVK